MFFCPKDTAVKGERFMLSTLMSGYAFDAAEPAVKWLTVAIAAALVLSGVIIGLLAHFKVISGKTAVKFAKYGALSFAAYALVAGILMLVLQLVKRTDPNYLEDKWLNADVINFVLIPLIVLFAALLASGAALFAVGKTKKSILPLLVKILGCVCLAGVIAAGVTIGIYYSRHIANDGYYSEYTNQIALYVSAAVLAVGAITAALVLGRKDKSHFDSRSIALAGICIALSFGLSYVKLWEMPQGGSVTLVSLLPIMIYAYAYGPKKGLLIGLIYGIMQAMQDPYIIHPAQFLLDYPVAFCFVAFAGAFAKIKALKFPQVRFLLGAILVAALRFAAHLLSGVFAFGATASDEGFSGLGGFFAYSAAYNSFVFADMALVIAAGAAVLSSKTFVKVLENYQKPAKTVEPVAEQPNNNDVSEEN